MKQKKTSLLLLTTFVLLVVVGCAGIQNLGDLGGGRGPGGPGQNANAEVDDEYTVTDGVIMDLTAPATGGGAPFDGTVDAESDLEDLVETAWGDGSLDLHRGHMPVENVLVAFLGISHDQMHVYMEEQGMNLAAVAEELELDPNNLVETLTYSLMPYVQEGVDNGVISTEEAATWIERIRVQFHNRVYWDGAAGASTEMVTTDAMEVEADTAAAVPDEAADEAAATSEATEAVSEDTEPVSNGVITDVTARGSGPGAAFDGTVDTASDLEALVETAWGEGGLGLHRGHAPIESVLVAFLGISHDQMHVYMEEQGMNLAAVSETLGLNPDDLAETLTYSFMPFVQQGVDNGVISADEADAWNEQIREQFYNRVYWDGS